LRVDLAHAIAVRLVGDSAGGNFVMILRIPSADTRLLHAFDADGSRSPRERGADFST